MGEWQIVTRMSLVVLIATGSGCAAFSDVPSDAQGSLALPIMSSVPASATETLTDTSPDPDSLVVAAEAPAGTSPEQGKEAPPKDEFYDPFAKDDALPGDEEDYDPWEGFNSAMFEFNRKADKYIVKPVAKVYDKVVPDEMQKGISNFFHNVHFGPRLINNVLQAKVKGAGIELSRFLINSTIGVAGFFDAARNLFDLTTPDEDSGQTLGVYGVPPGPYLVLPFFPPFNLRDFFGYLFDFGMDPVNYVVFPVFEVDNWPALWDHKNRGTTTFALLGTNVFTIVNERSLNLDKYQGVEEATVDLYSAVRNGYLQKRARAIRE